MSTVRTKHKRRRIHTSCLQCAKAKRKCCRKQPCDNCVLRGLDCEYQEGAKPVVIKPKNTSPVAPAISETNDLTHKKSPISSESTKASSSEGMSSWFDNTDQSVTVGTPASSSTDIDPKDFGICPWQYYMLNKQAIGRKFMLRHGVAKQRTTWKYYGANSGPALLFMDPFPNFRLPDESTVRFPKETIPRFDEIVEAYRKHVHWSIATFAWYDFQLLLGNQNVASYNRLIYLVLALGSRALGNFEEADQFELRSRDGDVIIERSSSSFYDLQVILLRAYFLDVKGQIESVWSLLGLGITQAISMGYHREWKAENGVQKGTRLPYHRDLRVRTWNCLLEMQAKYSITLGRPMSVATGDDEIVQVYTFVKDPSSFEEFAYRDLLNLSTPLSRELAHICLNIENHKMEDAMSLDSKIAHWWQKVLISYSKYLTEDNEVPYGLDRAEVQYDEFAHLVRAEMLSLHCYKSFLRTRLYRLFMRIGDNAWQAFCQERFRAEVLEFLNAAFPLTLHGTFTLNGDILAFAIEILLDYTMEKIFMIQKLDGELTGACLQSVQKILAKVKKLISHITKQKNHLAKLADRALRVSEDLEKGGKGVVHPVVSNDENEWTESPLTDFDHIRHPDAVSNNKDDILERDILSYFDLGDWNTVLRSINNDVNQLENV